MTFKEYQLNRIVKAFEYAMKAKDDLEVEGRINALASSCYFLTSFGNRSHWDDEVDPVRAATFGVPWNEVKNLGYKKSMGELVKEQGQCTADYIQCHERRTYSQVNGRSI